MQLLDGFEARDIAASEVVIRIAEEAPDALLAELCPFLAAA